FPSGVEKIRIGFKLARVYEIRIIGDQEQRCPDINQYVTIVGVDVVLFALPPFRRVANLRQQERRINRLQNFGFGQPVRRSGSQDTPVGKKLSAPPPLQNTENQSAPSNWDDHHFNLWELLLKTAVKKYVANF